MGVIEWVLFTFTYDFSRLKNLVQVRWDQCRISY